MDLQTFVIEYNKLVDYNFDILKSIGFENIESLKSCKYIYKIVNDYMGLQQFIENLIMEHSVKIYEKHIDTNPYKYIKFFDALVLRLVTKYITCGRKTKKVYSSRWPYHRIYACGLSDYG